MVSPADISNRKDKSLIKYWCVYYSKERGYQLNPMETSEFGLTMLHEIAIFKSFDMAYDYVTTHNRVCLNNAYARWTVNR